MEFAGDDVMTWPYSKRQLIVVESDDAVALARRAPSEDEGTGLAAGMVDAAAKGAVPGGLAGAAAGAAVAAAQHLWKTRRRADNANLPFLVVSKSQADYLSFQNGHPLQNVVYVGDPGVAGKYYPVASFHRFLFEGKVAEALRLLRSLGATEISIEYVEGFDRGAGVNLSVAQPSGAGADIGGAFDATGKTRSGAKTTMKLTPTMPAHIPKDLVWFGSEPLWNEVADARLHGGLQSFTIDVNYTDDFGINANLNAKIAKVGLETGGKLTEYRETIWKLSGSFATGLPVDTGTTQL